MISFTNDIHAAAEKIVTQFSQEHKRIVTAESCTGGLIAAAITEIPGSSAVFERGFIAYTAGAKTELLGVMPELINSKGIVSADVVEAMALGALDFSQADIAIATTGIAGPSGETPETPIGLVYIGVATKDGAQFHYRCVFSGNRQSIRAQAVGEALRILLASGTEAT
jgi:nicotinamide-nucleotide amidase